MSARNSLQKALATARVLSEYAAEQTEYEGSTVVPRAACKPCGGDEVDWTIVLLVVRQTAEESIITPLGSA